MHKPRVGWRGRAAWTASRLLIHLQLTVLNAGRRYLGVEDLAGKVFVTSGLGGMSGAQAKAAVIVGCIGVIAEVSLQECLLTPSRASPASQRGFPGQPVPITNHHVPIPFQGQCLLMFCPKSVGLRLCLPSPLTP